MAVSILRNHLPAALGAAVALTLLAAAMADDDEQPLPVLIAKLNPSGTGPGHELGRSVACREPFLLAGAWGASSDLGQLHGAAMVWRLHDGEWSQEDLLLADDRADGDRFGGAVALARPGEISLQRSHAVVGAHGADIGGLADAGAAYIFRRSLDGHWLQEQKLIASDPSANAQFGRAVAADGDLVAVGAPHRNGFRGAVYLFRLTSDASGAAIWTQEAILTSTGIFAGDAFGTSVAVAGDTVVVGAPGADIGLSVNQGAAYVFRKLGPAWLQVAKLVSPSGAMLDETGRSVGIDEGVTTIAVGTSPTFGSNLGVVHVFTRSGNAWLFDSTLTSPQPQVGEQFGSTVAVSGERILVGAPSRMIEGHPLRGAAVLFAAGPGGWTTPAILIDEGGVAGDSFGCSVSLSGETAVIGARGTDFASTANAGAVWIAWTVDCDDDGQYSHCLSNGGDLNGDGVVDGVDLGLMLGRWGVAEPWSLGDVNGDGMVDGADLGTLLSMWMN